MRTVYILPNLMTIANLFCGTISIYFAMQGKPFYAGYMIFAAMAFDFLDGEIARLTNTKSEFGLQLDSMSDLVSFGIAPIIFVYGFFLQEFEKIIWFFGFLYIACGALRLSRYNVQVKNEEKNYFSGLPIPSAAGLIVSYVLACLNIERIFILAFSPLIMIYVALLMVSNIRYPNLRNVALKIKISFILVAFSIFMAAARFSYLHYILFLCFAAYTLIGIFFEIRRRICLAK